MMRPRQHCTIALVSLCLMLTSCIVRYSEFPQVTLDGIPVPKKDTVIYYHADPLAYYLKVEGGVGVAFPGSMPMIFPTELPPLSQRRYRELSNAFADNHVGAEAIPATASPEKGVYCAVDVRHKSPSDAAEMFTMITLFSLGLLPSYSGESVDVVRFDLYVDSELKKIYRYQVRQDRWMWLGLLPFVWVNFFTAGTDEAFRAIVNQFLLDATKDGYL